MIVFDDAASTSQRWKTDRFAACRDIFEKFNKNCAKNMAPDDFLAIDETLYPNEVVSHSKHTIKTNLQSMD